MSATTNIKVSLGFTNLGDTPFINFGTNISLKLYIGTSFPDPPVDAAELNMALSQLSGAKAAQAAGGKAGTALKNEKRAVVESMLRLLAEYVQKQSNNNLSTLLSSGFDAVSTSRTRTPLLKPMIDGIAPGASGEVLVSVGTLRNAKSYEVRVAVVGPDSEPGNFVMAGSGTRSRNIVAANLIPGVLYLFQVRALGGLTGFSDWSDGILQRAV